MSQPRKAPAGVTQFVTPRSDPPKVPTKSTSKSASSAADQNPEEPKVQEPRPIPTMGFPAFWYQFLVSLNKNATPPRLSKKELASIAAKAEANRREQLSNDSYRLERELSDECPHLVVAFIGVKGAAATTTTMVHTASIFANDTRTLVYGADFNPASGTAGARLGKDFGQTISIQEFAAIVDELQGDRRSVNARLRPTEYGVRTLSADEYTKIPGEHYGTTTARMLNVLDENCDYLMLDTPNDITTPSARAIIAKADIIVFTANVGERDSLRLLRVSMDTVRELGHPDKVADSVVVVSNTPEGASIGDYEKYLGKVNLNHEVTSALIPGEYRGQIFLVPHDPVIALNGEVNLDAYRWETIQAYRDINIAILEQAIEAKKRFTIHALGRSTQ